MNFFTSLAKAGLVNNIVNYKSDFITKFGNYNEKFDQVDTLGNMRHTGPLILGFILAVILLIVCFSFSKNSSFSDKTKGIIYAIGWFFVIIAIAIMGYGLFVYLFIYLGQRNEWFISLPPEGRNTINLINSLTAIDNNLTQEQNRINNRRVIYSDSPRRLR